MPPRSGCAVLGGIGEPILPLDRAYRHRRLARERIAGEELQHRRLILQQPHFRVEHPAIVDPGAQHREPQVPLESRLIRREEARCLAHVLRLVAEWIGDPRLAIRGALELDFVSRARHDREKSVTVRDAERREKKDGGKAWHEETGYCSNKYYRKN